MECPVNMLSDRRQERLKYVNSIMHIICTNDYMYCMCITDIDMPTLLHEPIYKKQTEAANLQRMEADCGLPWAEVQTKMSEVL